MMLLEALTPGGFYLMFFGISAVIVGLLAALHLTGAAWVEWLLFSVIAIITLAFLRKPLIEKMRPAAGPAVDTLIGETAVALTDIGADGIGKAELRGSAWSARNVGPQPLTAGQRCKVENVEGLLLWIRG
ncbi:MAG: NfeD family protein [Acidobacteria bacterium]|nr:NfeD family protein [Acidobacteriota bacterium]